MPETRDLEALICSSTPIVVVETNEEQPIVAQFMRLSLTLPRPFFQWTLTEGLRPLGIDRTGPDHSREPTDVLVDIKMSSEPGVYLLTDFHPFLEEAVHIRLLKDIALKQHLVNHTVVLISHALKIPPELERYCARFELAVPTREELMKLVLAETAAWSRERAGANIRTNRRMLNALVENLRGVPVGDAKRLARGALDDGAITDDDLPAIMKAKFELLNQDGVLSFEYDVSRFREVGGLQRLKQWLELRRPVFTGELDKPGLDPPKGVLLLGVQGCGKSLAAKAVAGSWQVPLMRLDFGTLYNKFHGETERNLRESLRMAEVMEPCVLWIDEIEKGIGSDGMDGGTSRRVLGTLLTWLAEHERRVFIVATANDIESLPPELLRKGRLDEVFFVDLPDETTRRTIVEIHLAKRALANSGIDAERVATACEGFSGSELEQLVVASLYTAHAAQSEPTTEMLLEEAARTRPLSVVMAERISRLRAWAKNRTVPAH